MYIEKYVFCHLICIMVKLATDKDEEELYLTFFVGTKTNIPLANTQQKVHFHGTKWKFR